MDFAKSFTYVFEDSDWVSKVVTGTLLMLGSFLIIPIFFTTGYAIEVTQNIIRQEEVILPRWDDWGEKFRKGWTIFLIGLTYALPIIIVFSIGIAVLILAGVTASSSEDLGAVLGVIGIVAFVIGMILVVCYGLFLTLIWPAVLIQYATTEEYASAFRFKEMYEFIKKDIGSYILVILVPWGLSLVISLASQFCFLISFLTMFYFQLVVFHLYGQLYLNAQQ